MKHFAAIGLSTDSIGQIKGYQKYLGHRVLSALLLCGNKIPMDNS